MQQGTISHLNGLRGIAILMVVLFHCFSLFKNGFLGVDIFLVISGYLLFRRFWNDYESFDGGTFVAKKIQRLFPLAAAVALLSLVLSLLFFPYDLVWKTAKSALFAIMGCSNQYFDYTASDYFSADVRTNPLIHTWYLSLIAQIYFIYAIIAYACRRKSKGFKLITVCCITIASLVVYYSPIWLPWFSLLIYAPSTYYWTSGRLWMVCMGALAHFLPTGKDGRAMGGLSVVLLLLMGFSPFPMSPYGVMAQEILTVALSCWAIVYGGSVFSAYLLESSVARTIGQYSFSLYIIHWPVIIFGFYIADAYFDAPRLPLYVKLFVLCLVACLTIILYHFVELRKFRIVSCFMLLVLTCCLATPIIVTQGARDELHASVNAIRTCSYYEAAACRVLECGPLVDTLPDFKQITHHGGFGPMQYPGEKIPMLYGIGRHPEAADFVLMGDSHAEALYPGLDALAKQRGWSGAYLHTYVIPLANVYSEYRPYQRWDKQKAEMLCEWLARNEQIKTVLLANFWTSRFSYTYIDWDGNKISRSADEGPNFSCLYEFLLRLQQLGKRVIVFTDIPRIPEQNLQGYIRRQVFYGRKIDDSKLMCSCDAYEQENGELNIRLAQWEKEGVCTVLHPECFMLQPRSGSCFSRGVLLYKDGTHLSSAGSERCILSMEKSLQYILGQPQEK